MCYLLCAIYDVLFMMCYLLCAIYDVLFMMCYLLCTIYYEGCLTAGSDGLQQQPFPSLQQQAIVFSSNNSTS
ncbi:hypothetical protein BDF14DRAFT_1844186 [Spinellus fusiger]|nr:hypothetical protein BDF14DRAFT_1844186 [Spinellus fusiger]